MIPVLARLSRPRALRMPVIAVETAIVVGLTALVCVVHDVPYLLRVPFWVDESWVAASTKVSLTRLPWVSSTTPVLFTTLLRAAPGGQQGLRLLPLALAGAAGGAGYIAGRAGGLSRVTSCALLAVPILVTPAMLVRDDLKQYTAEGFWSVVVLALLLRLEAAWLRRRLAALTAACTLGVLLANADLFVGSAAMVSLAVVCLVKRRWQHLAEVTLAGSVAAVGMACVLATFVLPNRNQVLRHYWDAFYPVGGVKGAAAYLTAHFPPVAAGAGMGGPAAVVVLSLAAVVVICAVGRPAAALLLPAAFGENAVAGRARLFPFLDVRTSTWLCVLVVAVLGLGLGLVLERLAGRASFLALLLTVIACLGYVFHNRQDIRVHPILAEDVRSQVRYVDTHRRPGDVVVVDVGANWGFGYYGSSEVPRPLRSAVVASGYTFSFGPAVVTMAGRSRTDPKEAVEQAMARRGSGGRIFVVRSHVLPQEAAGWRDVRAAMPSVIVRCGIEPLLLLKPP